MFTLNCTFLELGDCLILILYFAHHFQTHLKLLLSQYDSKTKKVYYED